MTTAYEVLPFVDAIRDHLARHALPAPAGIAVSTWTAPVKVQLAEVGLNELASALLAWADSLEGATADLWRTPEGYSVHLTLVGRMRGGVPVHVYDSVAYHPATFPDLPPDTRQDVPLRVLRGWARGLGVAA